MWETSFEKYCIVRLWWLSFTNTLSWINVWLKQPTTRLKWLKYIKTECDCLLVGCGAEECLLHGFESKNSPYNLVLKIINITLLYHFPAGAGCQVWLHFVPLTTMMMTLDKAEVFKWSLPGIFSCVSLLPPTDSPPMYYCTTQQPLMLLLKRLTFSDEWIPPPDPVPSVNLPTPGNAARIAKLPNFLTCDGHCNAM